MKILELKNLTLKFGGLVAVNNVCFDVNHGEIFSVIGPNGAGKTSLFNAITGIYNPTSGEALFSGKNLKIPFSLKILCSILLTGLLTALALVLAINIQSLWESVIIDNYVYQQPFPWGKAVQDYFLYFQNLDHKYTLIPFVLGFILGSGGTYVVWQRSRRTTNVVADAGISRTFQNIRLFPQMTVLENVLVGMDSHLETRFWHAALRLPLYWREKKLTEKAALEILSFVELEKDAQLTSSSLPYGHQRRLEIARALAAKPKLLLLDEPAAGMNPTESAELTELIRKIKERGITILLIEHHMKVVMNISDRIAVLDYGNLIALGTPDEIKCNPKVIEAYLGKDQHS